MTTTAGQVAATKNELCQLLRAFINQRPGLDFANYGEPNSYRSEVRKITRQRADALQLLRAVELRDSITADDIRATLTNRLTLTEHKGRPTLDYCAGQYWCVEYRAAVCSVLSSVLWAYMREKAMPSPVVKNETIDGHICEIKYFDGSRAGAWLRRQFRAEFGRGIGSRWFN